MAELCSPDIDRCPNQAAIASAEAVYRRLAAIDPPSVPRFRFAEDAQQLFIAWLIELEQRLRDASLHPALVCHLAKYRKLMPSLALLFELADGETETQTVSLQHARQAAAWREYL